MNLEKLLSLGATVCGGRIDYKGKEIGFLAPGGEPVLVPDAVSYLATPEGVVSAATGEVSAGARRGRPRKSDAADTPVADE